MLDLMFQVYMEIKLHGVEMLLHALEVVCQGSGDNVCRGICTAPVNSTESTVSQEVLQNHVVEDGSVTYSHENELVQLNHFTIEILNMPKFFGAEVSLLLNLISPQTLFLMLFSISPAAAS